MFNAAKSNNLELVQEMLKKSANEPREEVAGETHDSQGVTPLMIALKEGHLEVAEAILGTKSTWKAKKEVMKGTDGDKNNVFHYALVSPKWKEATQLLVNQCPSKNSLKRYLGGKNISEDTPFHMLARKRNARVRAGLPADWKMKRMRCTNIVSWNMAGCKQSFQ